MSRNVVNDQHSANPPPLDMNVRVWPDSVDCSESGNIIYMAAEIVPEPVFFMTFEDVYLNRTRIDRHCYTALEKNNTLICEIPVEEFLYCSGIGSKKFVFEAFIFYDDGIEKNRMGFSKVINISISAERLSGCNRNEMCEPEIGESFSNCCYDCGCREDKICTTDNVCKDPSDIKLVAESPTPVKCDGKNGVIVINAEIINQPYRISDIEWMMQHNGVVFGPDKFSCRNTDVENEHHCDLSVYNTLCRTEGVGELLVKVGINFTDIIGQDYFTGVEDDIVFIVEGNAHLCGDGDCDSDVGETQDNCCMDCGCSESGEEFECTVNGCYQRDGLKLRIYQTSDEAECILVPALGGIPNPNKYLCKFIRPIEVEAVVDNLIIKSSEPRGLYYTLDDRKIVDGISLKRSTTRGWEFSISLRPLETENMDIKTEQMLGIGFTLVLKKGGKEIIVPLESENKISLTKVKKTEKLVSLEKKIEKQSKAVKKMERWTQILGFVGGFGFCCGSVGHLTNKAIEANKPSFLTSMNIWKAGLLGITGLAVGFAAGHLMRFGAKIGGAIIAKADFGKEWIKFFTIGCAFGSATGSYLCSTKGVFGKGGVKVGIGTFGIALVAMFVVGKKLEKAGDKLDDLLKKEKKLAKKKVRDDTSDYYK